MRGRIVVQGFRIGMVAAAAAVFTASPSAAQQSSPTFSKDIAPIFQAKCQECHQPNSIAPMSLIAYKEARPWARSIKDRVMRRQMPPWHIDQSVGVQEFKNDMSLVRRADRDDRALGGCRRARGRPARPASAEEARHRERVAGRDRRIRRAGPRHQVARLHDAGAAPGRLVPPDERHPDQRAALGEDGRDSSVEPEEPQDRPPLDRVSRAQQRPGCRQHGHRHGAPPVRRTATTS